MKLSVIGLGQCGGNIADELYAVNNYASSVFNRRLEILADVFAINTDEADLGGLKNIPRDKGHRILIGTMDTHGHGVGKINTDAACIIKSSNSIVTDTILRSRKFHESDAVLVIASGGGGTGSGTIGWVIKSLKERIDKPIYGIVVLPFAFEERGEISYAVMNTATCINTVSRYADAYFLIDNERYRMAGSDLAGDLKHINREIAWSFFDLCCAGEEKIQKYVGSKVIDAGDINRSLSGITSLGRGELELPMFRWNKSDYREGIRSQSLILGALRAAEGSTGLSVDLSDARKILVLVSAPRDALSVTMMEEMSNYLQSKCPKGVIRIGDYPRRGQDVAVTLIASQVTRAPRLESLFLRAEVLFKKKEEIIKETEIKIEQIQVLTRNLPTLA